MRSTQPAARRIERRVAGLFVRGREKRLLGIAAGRKSVFRTRHLPGHSHGQATAREREAGAGFAARAGHRQEDVMRLSKASQSRLNTIDANQPVAIAIIAVARP